MSPESSVNCPNCNVENRRSARYCDACGQPLGHNPPPPLGTPLCAIDLDRLPYPLARVCQILREYATQNQLVAVWLQVKDVFESAIKFSAAVAVADYVASPRFDAARFVALLRPILSKPPAFGDWLTLLRETLANHKVPGQPFDPTSSSLLIPDLYLFAYETGAGAADRPSSLFSKLADVVKWRNDQIGHGALGMNPRFIADDLAVQLDTLERLLGGLDFFTGYRLLSESWVGTAVEWTGPRIPVAAPTSSLGFVPYRRIYLEAPAVAGRHLDLTPLAVIDLHNRSGANPAPGFFFFDRMDFTARGVKRGDAFLDYNLGKKLVVAPEHPAIPELLNRLAAAERTAFYDQVGQFSPVAVTELLSASESSYDSRLQETIRLVQFGGDIERRFLLPEYLARTIRAVLDRTTRGYIHVVGAAGTGKSWLAAKLADRRVFKDLAPGVLIHHVQIGSRQSPVVFAQEITRQAERADGHRRITDLLVGQPSPERPANKMTQEFLAELVAKGPVRRVILVVDGLDELADGASSQPHIADYLPVPSELPEQCWVILTSRPEEQLRPRTAARIETLQADATTRHLDWERVEIDPASRDNADVLRRYLTTYTTNKRWGLRDPRLRHDSALVDRIISSSEGVFLRASHLCALLNAGTMGPGQPFPDSFAGLYEAYLEQFSAAVGQVLFDQIYCPILGLLGAVRDPVSLPVIAGALDLPPEKVLFALFDLAELLDSHRYPDDPGTYVEPAHESFREFMSARPHLVKPAHGAIAKFYLESFREHWALATDTRQGRYGLEHLAEHAEAGRVWTEVGELLTDDFLAVRRSQSPDWGPCVADATALARTALEAEDRDAAVDWALVAALGASTLYERTLEDEKAERIQTLPVPRLDIPKGQLDLDTVFTAVILSEVSRNPSVPVQPGRASEGSIGPVAVNRPVTFGLFADLCPQSESYLRALSRVLAACEGPRAKFECAFRLLRHLGGLDAIRGRRRAIAASLLGVGWESLERCERNTHRAEMWTALWVWQACADPDDAVRRLEALDPASWPFLDCLARVTREHDALADDVLMSLVDKAGKAIADKNKLMLVARNMEQAIRYAETIGFYTPQSILAAFADWNDPNERESLRYKTICSGARIHTEWAVEAARTIPDPFHRAICLVEVVSVAWNRLADSRDLLLAEAFDAVPEPRQRERVSFAIADLLAARDPVLALRHVGLIRNDELWGRHRREYERLMNDERFAGWDDVNREFRRIYYEKERHRFWRRMAWEGIGKRMPLGEVERVLEWLDLAGEPISANVGSNSDFASWRTDMWRQLLARIPLDRVDTANSICRRALSDLEMIQNEPIASQHATELWDAARPFDDTMARPFERFITIQHNQAHLRLSRAIICGPDDVAAALKQVGWAVQQPDVRRLSPDTYKMIMPTVVDAQCPFVSPEGWFGFETDRGL